MSSIFAILHPQIQQGTNFLMFKCCWRLILSQMVLFRILQKIFKMEALLFKTTHRTTNFAKEETRKIKRDENIKRNKKARDLHIHINRKIPDVLELTNGKFLLIQLKIIINFCYVYFYIFYSLVMVMFFELL